MRGFSSLERAVPQASIINNKILKKIIFTFTEKGNGSNNSTTFCKSSFYSLWSSPCLLQTALLQVFPAPKVFFQLAEFKHSEGHLNNTFC